MVSLMLVQMNQQVMVDLIMHIFNNRNRKQLRYIHNPVHDLLIIRLRKRINSRINQHHLSNNQHRQLKDNDLKEVSYFVPTLDLSSKFIHLASYAGIAKLHSSAGPTSNMNSTSTVAPRGGSTSSTVPPATSQQSNTTSAPVKTPLTTANRPNTNVPPGQQQQPQQQQQQRGNGNYYPQNNRGNYYKSNLI